MLRFALILSLLLPASWSLSQPAALPACGTRAASPAARPAAAADAHGGIYMTSRGTLRVLLVFASFPDDTTPNPYWPPHQPPLYKDQFIDPDTTTRSQAPFNLTNYFNQMSLGQFRLIGDAAWIESAAPSTDFSNNGSFGRANWHLLHDQLAPHTDLSQYDAWHRVGDYVHENVPDGLVDMIVMVWRTNIFPFNGEASLGHLSSITAGGETIAMGFPGSYPDTAGSGVTCEYLYTDNPVSVMHTMAHEIGHWLLGGLHPYSTEPFTGGKHHYWGIICSGDRRSSCANAWERETLGWIRVPEIAPDADLPLADYLTTGAALKFHPPAGDPLEYFYFENHQRLSPFDDVTANPADRGLWILHQDGPYAGIDNLRIEPSDGDWSWPFLGTSLACFPIPVHVFGRGLPRPGTGPSHRDMIPDSLSLVSWMNMFRDDSGELHCGAFFAGELFTGAFVPTLADLPGAGTSAVFSPFSNPPSTAWNGLPSGLALEVLRDSAGTLIVRSYSDPNACTPARRCLGLDPAPPPVPKTSLPLAWGTQWTGGQPLEPGVHYSILQRKVGGEPSWTTVYAGPSMSWVDSTLAYDATGSTPVSFRARVCDNQGKTSSWSNLLLARALTPGAVTPQSLPPGFSLDVNYPNPFNPSTSIVFSVPDRLSVTLIVYDLLGRRLRTLASAAFPPGRHMVPWDGKDDAGHSLPSGVYIYKLSAGAHTAARKMILTR